MGEQHLRDELIENKKIILKNLQILYEKNEIENCIHCRMFEKRLGS